MNVALTILGLVGFLALTAGTAVFVAAEFSLTALERSTVDSHAREGDRRSKQVQHAHRTLSFQLSGAQLGITITTLVTGYIAEPVLAGLLRHPLKAMGASTSVADGVSLALALLIATSLSMVFGELVPKNLAIAQPLRIARATAGVQAVFSSVFKVVINGLNGTANQVVRWLGVEPVDELRSARSTQELGSLVRSSARQGALDPGTAALLHRSLRFGERSADELMTPRVRIDTLDAENTVDDLLAAARRTGHSRFPVVHGDMDDPLGVVHVKQAFMIEDERRHDTTLDRLVRRVATVPSTLDGDALMDRLRGDGMQVAFVVDEYGGTAGLVTMEDLIEEIVGDVRDEHDPLNRDVLPTEDGWYLSGLLRTDEVADATQFTAPDGEYETIGGFVLSRLGRIPVVGDEIELDGWRIAVRRMDGRRVDIVSLRRPDEGSPAGDGEEASGV